MKQHITTDQINELSDVAKQRLRDWWQPQDEDLILYADPLPAPEWEDAIYYDGEVLYPVGEDLPILSIGRMIEFLMTTDYYRNGADKHWLDIGGLDHVIEDRDHTGPNDTLGIGWKGEELCDRLWECVKAALEHEDVGAMKSSED